MNSLFASKFLCIFDVTFIITKGNLSKFCNLLSTSILKYETLLGPTKDLNDCFSISNCREGFNYRISIFSSHINLLASPNSLKFWKFPTHPNHWQLPWFNSKEVKEKIFYSSGKFFSCSNTSRFSKPILPPKATNKPFWLFLSIFKALIYPFHE